VDIFKRFRGKKKKKAAKSQIPQTQTTGTEKAEYKPNIVEVIREKILPEKSPEKKKRPNPYYPGKPTEEQRMIGESMMNLHIQSTKKDNFRNLFRSLISDCNNKYL